MDLEIMAGEVSWLRAGSCLWLMQSRDCRGISLVHFNISVYYKCSHSVCSPVVRHGKLRVWVL